MSILDGMPKDEAELRRAIAFAVPIVEGAVREMKLPERILSVLDELKDGLSLADIMGITKEQRDGLLAHGMRLLQLGEIAKAREVLIPLQQLEPMDERTIYALATSYQLEGNYSIAGKLYVYFLALDATNPEGHLRLGECFLGAKEYDNAEESFDLALAFAKDAGDAACIAHATKMLEMTRTARAANGS
jgi:tetratricopeptide (TPR) repeat protein